MIFIIYPEKRYVSFQQIESWYRDACENGEIADEYLGFVNDPIAQANALSDAGIITRGKE